MWRHKDCGHEFTRTLWKLWQTHKCPRCTGQVKTTIEDVKSKLILENRPIQVLSTICPNTQTKIRWKCLKEECGHEWEAPVASVLVGQKSGCPICARNVRLTLEIINKRVESRPLKCLSTEYINNQTLLLWECNICKHVWKATSNNVTINGQGCPACGKVSMNITNAKRHKEKWEQIPAIVYFVRCWNENESFYKIGMTIHKTQQRLSGIPYNYEIIREIYTTRYKACFLEIAYQDKSCHYSYKPQIYFEGETECFSTLDKEVLYA